MNPYNNAAFGFSQAYQAQMAAANAQRQANQASDTAFADDAADDESALRGQPNPQAPTSANENINGYSETDFDQTTDRDLNLLARAKRRASRYLEVR